MDRLDRALWTSIAVLLLAVGALGIAAGRGRLHGVDPNGAVLPRWWLDQWHAWGVWALIGLCAVGLIMVWLGYRLLRAELRPRGHRAAPAEIVLESRGGEPPGGAKGETRLRGHALTHAAERALLGHPAIERARVGLRLSGDAGHPRMHARIDTTSDTDLRAVSEHVARTLHRLGVTGDMRFRSADVTVRPSHQARPRVR
ncbi:MAG: hypothetical protein ACRDOO_04705 [Actinomadura sp.]